MKSNIGFVFVVNSEKAFGRFVKESAGEEEMTSCSSSGEWLISSNFKLSSRRRESSREREESREALRQNLSGKRIPNFLFVTSNQIFGFFSFPPPKKCFFYISRWRLPIVSQVSQSLLPTLWGELSLACSVMGPSWGGCYFYLGIFCALPIVTDSDM